MRKPIEIFNAFLDGQPPSETEGEALAAWLAESDDHCRQAVELALVNDHLDNLLTLPRMLTQLASDPSGRAAEAFRQALEYIETAQQPVVVRPSEQRRTLRHYFYVAAAASVAAAAVTLMFASGQNPSGSPEPDRISSAPVATVVEGLDAVDPTGTQFHRGQTIAVDTAIQIRKGLIQLTTVAGDDLIVEGPAEIQFEQNNRVTLNSGKLTVRIGDRSHSFSVETPTAVVVDLGTEFGVSVARNLGTYVAVYEGKVTITGTGGHAEDSKLVTAGRSGKVDSNGVVDWTIAAIPHDREFVRFDEVESRRDEVGGSAEARQDDCFFTLQRVPKLIAFQGFDTPTSGAGYAIGFQNTAVRSQSPLLFQRDIQSGRLYSSGSLVVEETAEAFIDFDCSPESRLAASGLLDELGRVGRSGTELWLAWKVEIEEGQSISGGLSLMFGDQRRLQEPVFIGASQGTPVASVDINVGSVSQTVALQRVAKDKREPVELAPGLHWFVARIGFGERSDQIDVWCDIPPDQLSSEPPHASSLAAQIMFDRIRLGVDRSSVLWKFDDIIAATTLQGIIEAQAVLRSVEQ